jgi:hypothetical protein
VAGHWGLGDAGVVIRFMNDLVKRLRRRTILILDNASMHNGKIPRTWQVKWRQRRVEFISCWPIALS